MKQEKIWGIVILVLMVLSAWVVLGTHYDARLHRRIANYPTRFGLDIRGGVRAIMQAYPSEVPGVKWDTEEQNTEQQILENRINGAGVGEATVQPKGTDQFIVELPDVKNKDAILKLLGTTAQLKFYYFADVANPNSSNPSIANRPIRATPYTAPDGQEHYSFTDERTGQTFDDGAAIQDAFSALLAQGTNARTGATLTTIPQPLAATAPAGPIYLTPYQQQQVVALNTELVNWNNLIQSSLAANNGQPILTGNDIEPVSQAQLGGTGIAQPEVTQTFKASGTQKYATFTENHVGEIVGIVLDNRVISAPYIEEPIMDGQGEISGGFATLAEAKNLADLLNDGALPVPLKQVETESVEPSLGGPALHHIEIAGLVGLALVMVFMLLYYRLPGLVADIALLIYALFTFAIFKGGLGWLFPGFAVTLSLPGIAGFVLSIGMAVDANILIFERLKEELRNGRSLRGSIDAGFRRAFTAIRDSNICTSITCLVLLSFGTPSVRGFALTLLIGVLVSLFSAITVTRTLLYFLVDAGIGNSPKLFGLNTRSLVGQMTDSDTRAGVNIIGRRRFFYALSLLIIVPGLIFWLGLHGLKKGIEFTGGSQIQVQYAQPTTQRAVKAVLDQAGFRDNLVQMANGGSEAIVSVPEVSKTANPKDSPVYQKLAQTLGVENANGTPGPNKEVEFDNVGGTISKELSNRAVQAVVIAASLIVLYLAIVFSIGGFVAGLRLGLSAIVALLHDILVLVGLFAILGYFLNWQINSYFITALLTVIGFSVHDTVVIFDRVRENLRHKQRGETFEHLVNRSIQQTLARSINTSLTVIMTLLALVFLAGPTTRLLNVALLIGIISGTYSSIFNAASILVDWENWLGRRPGRSTPSMVDASPALSTAGGSLAASNGGSARPLPSRGAAPSPAPRLSDREAADGSAASRIRPKKKRPARRF